MLILIIFLHCFDVSISVVRFRALFTYGAVDHRIDPS